MARTPTRNVRRAIVGRAVVLITLLALAGGGLALEHTSTGATTINPSTIGYGHNTTTTAKHVGTTTTTSRATTTTSHGTTTTSHGTTTTTKVPPHFGDPGAIFRFILCNALHGRAPFLFSLVC